MRLRPLGMITLKLCLRDNENDLSMIQYAGLVTCWYNRKNVERPHNITPQFEIENLMDLQKIV